MCWIWSKPDRHLGQSASLTRRQSDNWGYPASEDCLVLNIVRPAGCNERSKLPIALWMHGGGFYEGGSADRRYNLSFIVENSVEMGKPIIGVSINCKPKEQRIGLDLSRC
jgi:carboxylesterase type B